MTAMGSAIAEPAATVLIVDDEEYQRAGLANMVSSWGCSVLTAENGEDALEKLAANQVHVIVTDLMMPKMDGFELLRRLGAMGSRTPAIVLTAFGNIETSVQTMRDLGAFWFLEKPIQPSALRLLLNRAASQSLLAEEAERLQRQLSYQGNLGDLVGSSPRMQEVFSLIRQVAPSRAAVLIGGESGTGKELAARAIHQLSPRRAGPFVAINCAAMPETLMESELFGHEKGAFTGAVERRAGCFELAQNGTLLLDELAEMPVGTQAKLLRVLEDSRVRRLGGRSEIEVDVRIIAATNKNIDEAVKNNELREDLFYRLNVFRIDLPSLRARDGDLPVLTSRLVELLNQRHGCKVTEVEPAVIEAFARHSWPGNVRELRNVLERAVIVAGEGPIGIRHLPLDFGAGSAARVPEPDDPGAVRLRVGTTVSEGEKALILLTLKHTKNNKTRAADILGISLKTLFNKLKEYGTQETAEAG